MHTCQINTLHVLWRGDKYRGEHILNGNMLQTLTHGHDLSCKK